MSYTPDSNAQAALDSKARGAHWLIEAQFSSGTGRYTTAPVNVDSPDGNTYIGLGHFLQVGDLSENAKPEPAQLTIKIAIVNKAMLAQLTGDQSIYRGKPIIIYAQFFTGNFAPTGMPIKRWVGQMNPIKVTREPPDEENGKTYGFIELPCTKKGMSNARRGQGMRMTHEQHILTYPDDLFFEYQQELAAKKPPWLTKEFQKV